MNKKKLLYTNSGIIISYFFIWAYILRQQTPYEINFSFDIISITFLAILILFHAQRIKAYISPSKNNLLPQRLKQILVWGSEQYSLSLKAVLELLCGNKYIRFSKSIQKTIREILKIISTQLLLTSEQSLQHTRTLLLETPRLIFAITFTGETIINNKIQISLELLGILLIPICTRIIISIITFFLEMYIELINQIYTLQDGKLKRINTELNLPTNTEKDIQTFYWHTITPIKHALQSESEAINLMSMTTSILYIINFTYIIIIKTWTY